jgi:hypothetical protein
MPAVTPDEEARREPYETPEIRRINVVPEEMAVAGCKTQTAKKGPFGNGCFFAMCKAVGS